MTRPTFWLYANGESTIKVEVWPGGKDGLTCWVATRATPTDMWGAPIRCYEVKHDQTPEREEEGR